MRLAPGPAALLLAAAAAAALLSDHLVPLAVLTGILALVCLRAPAARSRPYLIAAFGSAGGVLVVWPFLQTTGVHVLWEGPVVPVIGLLDVTWEEIVLATVYALRLAAVGLAFAAYALLVDHDRLVAAAGFARRSALAVALATRLVPTLERDAVGLTEALRGRGVAVAGVRGRARLLSPLVAGSLERAASLAESMEARGYGRSEHSRAPGAPWSDWDRAAVVAAPLLVLAAALWL
jgi:energy-coupling factor transporter transmembrane protein EcfT